MTEPTKPAPPPAPPAPVVGSQPNVGAPTPEKLSPKETILAKAARLRFIAGRISTPNVVDTQVFAKELMEMANDFEKIAAGM